MITPPRTIARHRREARRGTIVVIVLASLVVVSLIVAGASQRHVEPLSNMPEPHPAPRGEAP